MSDVTTSSIFAVGLLIGAIGLVLSGVAAWRLRNIIPMSREERLEDEVRMLRAEVERLQHTVDTLTRRLAEDQRRFDEQELRNQRLEQRLAALTGNADGGGTADPALAKKMRELIVEKLTLEELRELACDVGVELDNLPGEGLEAKAMRLIDHFNRRGKFGVLLLSLRQARPDVKWA